MGFKQGTRWWYASAEHRKGVGHKGKCADNPDVLRRRFVAPSLIEVSMRSGCTE